MRVLYSLENCVDLDDDSEILELYCSQAAADTIMLSIYSHARAYLGLDKQVVIDTEDTDIYVQFAYVARELPGLKLYRSSKDNNFIDCKALCSSEMAEVVIQLHVLTGCDSNSVFFGIGLNFFFQ